MQRFDHEKLDVDQAAVESVAADRDHAGCHGPTGLRIGHGQGYDQ